MGHNEAVRSSCGSGAPLRLRLLPSLLQVVLFH